MVYKTKTIEKLEFAFVSGLNYSIFVYFHIEEGQGSIVQ